MEKNRVIVTEAVTKEYPENGMPVLAVRGIDLTITRGEFSAIVGPSGSGKTTFLNLISGLDSLTSGKIWLNERLISEMSGKELSDFRRDNIGFILLLQGVPAEERSRRIRAILKELDLEGFENRRPPQLSGGQQQRVAVARAIVSEPAIVLADEPTANLDSRTAVELIEMMRRLNEDKGITFVFSTHDARVMKRARRLIVLRDGRIDSDEVR
jgi:putative ABC transport system ATP-binding protein